MYYKLLIKNMTNNTETYRHTIKPDNIENNKK